MVVKKGNVSLDSDSSDKGERFGGRLLPVFVVVLAVLAAVTVWIAGVDAGPFTAADSTASTPATQVSTTQAPSTGTSVVPSTSTTVGPVRVVTAPTGPAAGSNSPTCENAAEQAAVGFFAAMANGDAAEAETFFATDDFDGYTEVPHRTDDAARDRNSLLEYFQTRAATGAEFHLVSRTFYGGTGDRQANFGVDVRNEDGDSISGQGTVNCQTGKIIALFLVPLID